MKNFNLLFAFTLVVTMISCYKDSESVKTDDLRLSTEEIESVGTLHNYYVEQGFENFDFSRQDKRVELHENFLLHQPDISIKDVDKLLASVEERFEVREYAHRFSNKLTMELYEKLIEISNQKIIHYDIYLGEIMHLMQKTNSELHGFDKEFMLLSIEVAKNSALLWLPVEKGGQGFYSSLEPKLFPIGHINSRNECIDSIIAADIGGLAGAFFGWGSTLIAIPGANAGIAAALAFAAAWSSSMTGLLGCDDL